MNLLKALATVSGMTLISRILGFVRDVLIARIFGAGIATDAFFVAFRIPNLLRRLFAEGAFSQAFVPIFAEYNNRRTLEESQELVNHVATLLFIVLFLVTLIGVVAAPWIIYISAPGFAASPEKFALTIELLRITFPYILFISLVSLAGGSTQYVRQIFGAGVNAGIAESLIHRLLGLACAPDRSTGNGARMGSIYRRPAPACLPGAVSHAYPIPAETPPQVGQIRAHGASSGKWVPPCSAYRSARSAY